MTPANPLLTASRVAAILDAVALRYVIGGSVASSLAGEPRTTLDVDFMIDYDVEKTRDLAERLSMSFYVDVESAVAAAKRRGSFNAIEFDSSVKVDFFVAEANAFAEEALRRGRRVTLPSLGTLSFYATEDLIVRKLLWFRQGNEISERQWRDVIGMLRLNRALDWEQIRESAHDAGVADLIERAKREVE